MGNALGVSDAQCVISSIQFCSLSGLLWVLIVSEGQDILTGSSETFTIRGIQIGWKFGLSLKWGRGFSFTCWLLLYQSDA